MSLETASPVSDYEKRRQKTFDALKKLSKSSDLAKKAARVEMPEKSQDDRYDVVEALYRAMMSDVREGDISLKDGVEEFSKIALKYVGSSDALDEEQEVMKSLS